LRKRLEILEKQMKQTDKRLQEASEQAKSAEKLAAATRQSLEWLEKKLPSQVAVPVHPATGKPSLDAATWEELRKIFIGRDDIEFERRNQEAIRAISLEMVEDKVRTGAVIGRDSFVELLESELQKVKADMEDRFNANAGDMQNEILAKIRAQQDMFEKSGSWKKSEKASTQDVSQVNIPTKDGSDARQAIMDLIEAALEVYSADRIARRDFALYSAGARVIPSLTSPTYKLQSKSFFGFGGRKQETARPPVLALHHDTTPGMCWAFDGDDGQLGIGLARKVIVSDITLEHVASSISLEAGSSAPRDVAVWALVERREDRKRLAAHRQALQQSSDLNGEVSPAPAPPSQNHLLLASFTYDITSPRTIQTFSVSNEAKSLQIPTSIIQVRVSSNYGNKDFTCLYRVRVHGKEWNDND
jgi:SUN domain-containing protein 1/2